MSVSAPPQTDARSLFGTLLGIPSNSGVSSQRRFQRPFGLRFGLRFGLLCRLCLGLLFGLLFELPTGCQRRTEPTDQPTLAFFQEGVLHQQLLPGSVSPPTRIVAFDPYYRKEKAFLAVPLAPLLSAGFKGKDLSHQHLILRCRDGYTVPVRSEVLMEEGAYLALSESDSAVWEPIGPQRTDPRPFYLFWTRPHQQDLEAYPRPWQLVGIELARFEKLFPHVIPVSTQDAVQRGFRLFSEQCIRCHAINREGGRIGPDLNVPQSIVEYRPIEQIRSYIVNPLRFRYSNMPPHPHLGSADLDALLSYFSEMKDHKHDPEQTK